MFKTYHSSLLLMTVSLLMLPMLSPVTGFAKAHNQSVDLNQPVTTSASKTTSTVTTTWHGYQIMSANQMTLQTVTTNGITLWNHPAGNGSAVPVGVSNTINGQLVRVSQIATQAGRPTYLHLMGLGPHFANHDWGWILASAVQTPTTYQLPFYYSSQLYPTYAPDACEAIALKMALSVKGQAMNVSNHAFINGIPRSHNPNLGYTADPYRHGSHATIYPAALARYAKKWTPHAQDITGASIAQLISAIQHGNPVVFEGSYRMQNTKSDHILVLVGYKPGYFEVADPYMYRKSPHKVFWTSVGQFAYIFQTKQRGMRAMVLN